MLLHQHVLNFDSTTLSLPCFTTSSNTAFEKNLCCDQIFDKLSDLSAKNEEFIIAFIIQVVLKCLVENMYLSKK